MSHGKMHLVVEVGAEGGSLSLFASESLVVPEYVLTIVDQTLLFIDEGGVIEGERGRATSWRGALKLLDQYPWHMPYRSTPRLPCRIRTMHGLPGVPKRIASTRRGSDPPPTTPETCRPGHRQRL